MPSQYITLLSVAGLLSYRSRAEKGSSNFSIPAARQRKGVVTFSKEEYISSDAFRMALVVAGMMAPVKIPGSFKNFSVRVYLVPRPDGMDLAMR